MIEAKLYATLRAIAGSKNVTLERQPDTVGAALEELIDRFPDLREGLLSDEGEVRPFVAVMVDGRDIRHLAGLDTPLPDDATLDIFPPVAGGAAPEPDAGGAAPEPDAGGAAPEPVAGGAALEPDAGGAALEPDAGGAAPEPDVARGE